MLVGLACWVGAGWLTAAVSADAGVLFQLGEIDGSAMEFGGTEQGWRAYRESFPQPVDFTPGQDPLTAWPYIHPSHDDQWAGGRAHPFTLRFSLPAAPAEPQFLVIGQAEAWTPAELVVSVNGESVGRRRASGGSGNGSGDPREPGVARATVFPVPAGLLRSGGNTVVITLEGGSWIQYDYVRLGSSGEVPRSVEPDLLTTFRAGPMHGVKEIVFAARKVIPEHWYANFGYYAADTGPSYFKNSNKLYRDGARLCRLNVDSGEVTTLLDDPAGGIRDPQVHYDGQRILFSYRRGGTPNYLLYEIGSDGTGLRQLTQGLHDDFEPSYLPDGGIVFVSSRCNRWVNCWLTQVAVLYRCDADGANLRPLSSNNEHDNTPWPLPDGRILYTRWEYVDRSQVDYHHLWFINPDGTGQMTFFGNLHPGTVMIDAKPIPGSTKIVASFSPGHGQTEHEGAVAVIDPEAGPDRPDAARRISRAQNYRDPWAFSETAFLAAQESRLVLMDERGRTQDLFSLSAADRADGLELHEPRPLLPRPREVVVPSRIRPEEETGRLLLADIHEGRQMTGVKRGEIKKLLVLETLPKPVNFTGGMDPLSYGGTFTLERVLGTVPVEADGSAYFDVPALRSVFFVALDEQDRSVKRMQSFVTVQPGEVTGCVGCHEQRTQTMPPNVPLNLAARRAPSRIEPVADVPDVLDFPRDIQPILDRLCTDCHGYEQTARGGPYAGRLLLAGDRGPMFSHSYFMMTVKRLFEDGRNEAKSNLKPRAVGSSASRILKQLDGSHHDVRATPLEEKTLRLWIESGAPYPGTYAALGSGMIGGYAQNTQEHVDFEWPTTKAGAAVIERRCASCHEGARRLPKALADEIDISFWRFEMNDPRLQFSRHKLFNLDRPENSLLLLAPLAVSAGGFGLCATNAPAGILPNREDADYRALLGMVSAGKTYLERIKRFDMEGFEPRPEWVREMRRYGVLPPTAGLVTGPEVYAVEQQYWQSLWPRPELPLSAD